MFKQIILSLFVAAISTTPTFAKTSDDLNKARGHVAQIGTVCKVAHGSGWGSSNLLTDSIEELVEELEKDVKKFINRHRAVALPSKYFISTCSELESAWEGKTGVGENIYFYRNHKYEGYVTQDMFKNEEPIRRCVPQVTSGLVPLLNPDITKKC